MPISIRLENEIEKQIIQIAKRLNVNKTEIIRRCLKKYLSEIVEESPSAYSIYSKLEEKIPSSGQSNLSVNHRSEVLKRIKEGKNL